MAGVKRLAKRSYYLAAIGVLSTLLFAQETNNKRDANVARDITIENSYLVARGEILAKGENSVAVGQLRVKSYRLERIKLSRTLTIGAKRELHYDYLLRLVITGKRFDSNFTVWVNDRPFLAIPSADRTEIHADFLMGANVLENDATLAVSKTGPLGFKEGDETVLPERLFVPDQLRAAPPEGDSIRLRTAHRQRTPDGRALITIVATTRNTANDFRDQSPAIQVGKHCYFAGGDGHEFRAFIPDSEFFQIPENSQIFVTWVPCGDGEFVGRLHKGDLDH